MSINSITSPAVFRSAGQHKNIACDAHYKNSFNHSFLFFLTVFSVFFCHLDASTFLPLLLSSSSFFFFLLSSFFFLLSSYLFLFILFISKKKQKKNKKKIRKFYITH